MSTRFSHLSREPKRFDLDLTPFLESEYGEGYFYYTDNHSEEYLIPTMVVVLNYIANNPFQKEKYGSDYNYEHFWSSCLSYIEHFYNHINFENLDFFKNKYEIVDALLIFSENNKDIIDFKLLVNNSKEKESLIDLFLYVYEYGINKYNLKKIKNLKLSNSKKITEFLNKFIEIKKN